MSNFTNHFNELRSSNDARQLEMDEHEAIADLTSACLKSHTDIDAVLTAISTNKISEQMISREDLKIASSKIQMSRFESFTFDDMLEPTLRGHTKVNVTSTLFPSP